MPYIILCQSCLDSPEGQTKDFAMAKGWTLDDDPYMPHWYCPDCKEQEKP